MMNYKFNEVCCSGCGIYASMESFANECDWASFEGLYYCPECKNTEMGLMCSVSMIKFAVEEQIVSLDECYRPYLDALKDSDVGLIQHLSREETEKVLAINSKGWATHTDSDIASAFAEYVTHEYVRVPVGCDSFNLLLLLQDQGRLPARAVPMGHDIPIAKVSFEEREYYYLWTPYEDDEGVWTEIYRDRAWKMAREYALKIAAARGEGTTKIY